MEKFESDKNLQTEHKRFLEFNLGGESYAVELLMVKEVITLPEMTTIPKAPHYVCGLMNLRGLVLTVIDLRKKLGITPGKDSSQNGVIIFDLGERLVGAVVDSIQKVLTISQQRIKPLPENEGKNDGHFLGILQHEDKLCMWIDPHALLDGSQGNLKAS